MTVSSRSQSSRRVVSLLAGVAVLAAACAQSAVGQEPAPAQAIDARVETGALRGRQADGVNVFKGIPYAAPPVGDLRWRPPAKAAAWQGVKEADRFGFDCVQNKPGWDATQSKEPQNEDCLTLNVWAPTSIANGGAAKAPVMVWIHGGGYVMGSGSQPIFDGARLARRGVVVVTFNYRLGRFGFFAHPALTAEAAGGPVGNYGYMDQVAALEWVKRNIAAFGGDPAQVTIFGESAGGGSVNQLLLMAPSRGLFARAIVQSGGGGDQLARLTEDRPNKAAAETTGKAFAAKAGVTSGEAAALRALPAKTVLGGLDLLNMEEATYSGPFIDGKLVTSNAAEGFAAGRQAKVPYLVGANSDELGVIPALFRGGMVSKALKQIGGDTAAVEAAYGSKGAMNDRFLSDFNFVEPARRLAGLQADADAPTWLYSFGYVPEAKRKSQKGAPHASDLAFVFGNLTAADVKATPADEAAATLIGDYWVAFAKTGDPNGGGRAAWPAYSRTADTLLSFTNEGPAPARPDAGPLDAIGKLQARP